MQLRYGSYAHDDGEVEVSITRRTEFGQRGAFRIVETWDCRGQKVGSSQSDLTAKLRALENAYSRGGFNVVLLDSNGSRSVHEIVNARTVGGVQIVKPITYPTGTGAEYSTFRSYEFTLEASYVDAGFLSVNGGITDFTETIVIEGGGPTRVVIELDQGDPVEQITRDRTAYRATQSGRLSSLFENPEPPRPKWPSKLVGRGRISRSSPIESNGVPIQWPVEWSYEFLSATPLR